MSLKKKQRDFRDKLKGLLLNKNSKDGKGDS